MRPALGWRQGRCDVDRDKRKPRVAGAVEPENEALARPRLRYRRRDGSQHIKDLKIVRRIDQAKAAKATQTASAEVSVRKKRGQDLLIATIKSQGVVQLTDLERIQEEARMDRDEVSEAFLDLLSTGQVVDRGIGYAVPTAR
jgi:hypothetical protein